MREASHWSGGYPVRESYPASWHGFQSPAHLKLVCAINGVAWDVDAHTPMCIAEVGCGTGYTALMLAAGNPNARVVGLDYNPAHIAEARAMAAEAGLTNVQFLEADVSELGRPGSALLQGLPAFDLVTAHGLWSWVADDVRAGLLALLQARLKPGGLALVSYNALPGAAGALGLSRLVRQALNGHADTADGVAAAASLVQGLVAAEAAQLPASAWRQMLMSQGQGEGQDGGQDGSQGGGHGGVQGVRSGYLLHEFSTRHWRPSFQSDVAAALGSVRCDYVGSASLDENFAHMSLSPAQRALWEQAPDATARELIFDLCVPRPFRRDVYVRGLRRVPSEAAVGAMPFMWVGAAQPAGAPAEVVLQTQQGEARLPQDVIDSVCAALASGPQRINELRRRPACDQVTACELAAVLAGSGCALPLWQWPGSGTAWVQAQAAARRLNVLAARRMAPGGEGAAHFGLATPLLGGGLRVSGLALAVAQRLLDGPGPGLPDVDADAIVHSLLPAEPAPNPHTISALRALVVNLLQSAPARWRALGILPEVSSSADRGVTDGPAQRPRSPPTR